VNVVASNGTKHLSNLEWSPTMKRMNFRNALHAALLMGGSVVATSALAQSPGGWGSGMMGGYGAGWMGGYGGMWVPILVIAVVAGLVAWIIAQKKK
jgi:uncharacterized membrane protein